MIAFVEGGLTIRAKRKPYYRLWKFRGKYRDNPYVNNHRGLWDWLLG
jgi:hypothetical protein